MKSIITIALICVAGLMTAQVSIKVEVSADTIAAGETVEVIYSIDNGEGRFEPPDLTGLPLISGPNTSSSFMIQNGKKSSSQSYTYIFKPMEEGEIIDRKSTRLNSSHLVISYAVFCLKKKRETY